MHYPLSCTHRPGLQANKAEVQPPAEQNTESWQDE